MPNFRLRGRAAADIDQIAAYTTITWGWRQSDRYLAQLEDGFDLLSRNPSIGRSCDSIRPGMKRFEIGCHVVFYIPEASGIQIVRVLHQQMLPAKYL